jgi:hypothetical protein
MREHSLTVFENFNATLHNFYFSLNIIKVTKTKENYTRNAYKILVWKQDSTQDN